MSRHACHVLVYGTALCHSVISLYYIIQVLVIGMYSVGKTSFLRYLAGAEIPGQKIGPEPTSDKFTVIMHGRDNRTLPGNTLALKKDMPYKGLEKFGSNFLVCTAL
jgi:EH domain-containing protein 1